MRSRPGEGAFRGAQPSSTAGLAAAAPGRAVWKPRAALLGKGLRWWCVRRREAVPARPGRGERGVDCACSEELCVNILLEIYLIVASKNRGAL